VAAEREVAETGWSVADWAVAAETAGAVTAVAGLEEADCSHPKAWALGAGWVAPAVLERAASGLGSAAMGAPG